MYSQTGTWSRMATFIKFRMKTCSSTIGSNHSMIWKSFWPLKLIIQPINPGVRIMVIGSPLSRINLMNARLNKIMDNRILIAVTIAQMEYKRMCLEVKIPKISIQYIDPWWSKNLMAWRLDVTVEILMEESAQVPIFGSQTGFLMKLAVIKKK